MVELKISDNNSKLTCKIKIVNQFISLVKLTLHIIYKDLLVILKDRKCISQFGLMSQPEQIANADLFQISVLLFLPVESVGDQLEDRVALGDMRLEEYFVRQQEGLFQRRRKSNRVVTATGRTARRRHL
jgi:hypothetical protein